MKLKSTTILVALLSLAMLFAMVSAAGAQDNEVQDGVQVLGNFGFVPNSGEASVSKVDLETYEEIARYYTAERDGNEYDWRTSRIAQDADGNAWVLNVGADGTNLQGAVVRIQADTEGLKTHLYPDAPLDFGDDEAVQVFDVGAPGEMPRAIAIDSEGYIWIGFYSGSQLTKYEYDADAKTLTPVDQSLYPEDGTITYYEMKFAPDGTLFISSRASTPTISGDVGIWTFDGSDFVRETNFDPYSILIADDGTVYVTAYSDQLYIRDKDTGEWSSIAVGGPQNRGMAFDDFDRIWITSTSGPTGGIFGGTVVYSYNIIDETVGPTYDLITGTTPVGVGKDYNGVMWTICRSDGLSQGYIEGFNPENQEKIAAIQVGFRPYAYGDFTQTAPLLGCLNVTKEWVLPDEQYFDVELPNNITVLIEGPSFGDDGELVVLEAAEGWSYEICNLELGEYTITELNVDGETWSVVYLVDGMQYTESGVVEVKPGQTAEVTIRNAYLFADETFWAILNTSNDGGEVEGVVYHNNKVPGNPSNAWGWTNFINESGTYEFELWAGAGQNDINNGVYVGILTVEVEKDLESDTFTATVNYNLDPGYVLAEYHLWVGDTPLPMVQRGRNTVPTAAPGQFPYCDGDTVEGLSEDGFFVAAHGVVRIPVQ